ncbi:hypothetical protein ACJX0J_020360, partial [Zea mays]
GGARPAQGQSVRALPQRAHGDHRADQDVARRRRGRRRVARGARVPADRRRDPALPRRHQPVGLPAAPAAVRRARGEEQDQGRCRQEGRLPAAAHRRGAAEAGRRRRRRREEEHDRRDALAAEVGAGRVHGHHDHGTVRELVYSRNGDDVVHDRMGHVAAAEPPGGAEEGRGRDRGGRGRVPPHHHGRRAGAGLPAVRHQRDAAPVPGGPAAAAARVGGGLHGRRLRRAPRHAAVRQRVRHPQGPGGVGGAGRVQAGA